MKKIKFLYVLLFCSAVTACDSFLDVDDPVAKIPNKSVFGDDVTATSAITGIYQDMIRYEGFASGAYNSVSYMAGLSSDELKDFYRSDLPMLEIEENRITTGNSYVSNLWQFLYKTIFQTNSAMEGLQNSSSLTSSLKDQLLGEALFTRAFAYFYLVNLFGDVPLVLTTDYEINSKVSRTPVSQVYKQIIDDLKMSQSLLGTAYPTEGKVRPNKFVATALLARVYLYTGQWSDAEVQASDVIEKGTYKLVSLSDVFIANSDEAIWQLMPTIPNFNTWEGYLLAVTFLGPQSAVLDSVVVKDFEPNDNRLSNWVGVYDTGMGLVYFPYKYKQDIFAASVTEYSMVLRLAEQYLIRSEARLYQDKLQQSIEDLDTIRARAGLPSIQDENPAVSKDDLILAIAQERRVELFTEWGHRWFDLKRTSQIDKVLSMVKEGWKSEDALYPIPDSEFKRNKSLGEQNSGY